MNRRKLFLWSEWRQPYPWLIYGGTFAVTLLVLGALWGSLTGSLIVGIVAGFLLVVLVERRY